MFDHLLSKAGKTFWVYGGLTCKVRFTALLPQCPPAHQQQKVGAHMCGGLGCQMYPIKHLEVGGVSKGALEHIVAGGHVALLHNPTIKQARRRRPRL